VAVEGRCRAETDEHCRRSEGCHEHGRCEAINGACYRLVTPGYAVCGCQHCRELDRPCAAGTPCRALYCFPASDADCQRSVECRQLGWCAAADRMCVAASDDHCQQSDECRGFGRCHQQNGVCVAGPR